MQEFYNHGVEGKTEAKVKFNRQQKSSSTQEMYLTAPKSRENYLTGLRSQAHSKQAKREVYAGLIDEPVYKNASQDNNIETIN